ncbi:MAG TPA: DUF3499 domain-containing protein [Dermatophilaceae bacterium]|mgnify:CR=1 FL=1|nr:DUF3499 domain-containing protein [Dermatophilaceae bacterium]
MGLRRQCSKTGCQGVAVATLTYVYADQTAVLGPLATFAEPHTYDLCATHAERLTVPRGWEVVRLPIDPTPPPPSQDDLLALADAVREAARPRVPSSPAYASAAELTGDPSEGGAAGVVEGVRRGHLRALRSP